MGTYTIFLCRNYKILQFKEENIGKYSLLINLGIRYSLISSTIQHMEDYQSKISTLYNINEIYNQKEQMQNLLEIHTEITKGKGSMPIYIILVENTVNIIRRD